MSSPKVSVLMTVFNGMPYLEEAVTSILDQTLSDFQFVIVDDGSTDETAAFLNSIDDSRIKVVHQKNGGTAAAANHGLSLVETEFVARMDADDVAMLDRLEKQLRFMEENPDVGIVGSQVAPIGAVGVGKSLNLPETHESIFDALMTGRHGLAHSSLMIRTATLKELGGYWKHRLIDDWDMMLRMGEVSKLANISDVLLNYRVHAGSLNGTSMMRMHRNISYAIDCAKKRQSGAKPISYEEFQRLKDSEPFWRWLPERIHVYALTQYRLAVADIFGGHKFRGYARLCWSALCSPTRTFQRFGRILKKNQNEPGAKATDSSMSSSRVYDAV